MELHQVRYAVAVARHRQFSRAADELWVSRATISQQIKKLEAELGVALFKRTTRRVQVTAVGRAFVEAAIPLLDHVEALQRIADEYRSDEKGRILLGTPPTTALARLPDVLIAFREKFPGIELKFREGSSAELERLLLRSDIDLCILSTPSGKRIEGVEQVVLERRRTGIVLSPLHPLAARRQLLLSELADLPVVLASSGFAMREIALEALARAKMDIDVQFESKVTETIANYVRAGMGYAFLTESRAAAHGLPFIMCDPAPLDRVITLAWQEQPPLPHGVSLLRELILDELSEE